MTLSISARCRSWRARRQASASSAAVSSIVQRAPRRTWTSKCSSRRSTCDAIGRSARAGNDSETIAWLGESEGQPFARLQAEVDRQDGTVQLETLIVGAAESPGGTRAGKRFRVNAIPRRSIDFVGHARAYLYIPGLPLVPVAIMASVRTVGRGPRVKTEDEQAVLSTSLLANPVLRRTLIAGAVAVTAQDLFQFYMPIYGHSVGLSASAIGVVLAMSGIAAFLVRIWLPTLVKRWGPDAVFNGSLFIAAVTFVLFPAFTSAPALAAIALVLGLGIGCAQPVTLTLIFSRAPEGRSGEALGMRVTINQLTHIAVPVIFGSIGSVFGLAPVFFTNALILAGGGLLNRERNRPQAGAGHHR